MRNVRNFQKITNFSFFCDISENLKPFNLGGVAGLRSTKIQFKKNEKVILRWRYVQCFAFFPKFSQSLTRRPPRCNFSQISGGRWFLSIWGGKCLPQAENFEDLGIWNAKFPLQKYILASQSFVFSACGGLFSCVCSFIWPAAYQKTTRKNHPTRKPPEISNSSQKKTTRIKANHPTKKPPESRKSKKKHPNGSGGSGGKPPE